ncbi:hydrogenase expression/formation protein HypC [Roseospira marina]|nr:hydrogenase expression/formation protein HypC [Roseospira marina]MBB5087597.1 hydrogenase expression/formation protein HypC [Roseospira marina]
MRVVEIHGSVASCSSREGRRAVSLALIDPPPLGSWVLVHRDTAHMTLTADEARLIDLALDGVEAARRGGSVDPLFADLVEREPTLPPHLRSPGTG